ncbi:hypothetical protein [Nocardioides acrostichi]|uniref:Uncharacterized protein n=1 Tax=Nocardioides acrostichi TaxID=2784339 RepID=A0A930UZ02_9ACTN|nr:hypothetical protein [Nocardioides acrostichi]MBF4160174.1 hypothetical protein [Nocardioides acrostichi]
MLQTLRMLSMTMMSSLVVIGVAMFFVLAPADGESTIAPTAWLLGIVVLGVAVAALVGALGYRLPPIAPGTDPTRAGRESGQRFQAAMMLRIALCDAVAIVALALAFVVSEGGLSLYLLGAVISLGLMVLHVLPGEGPISRSERALERDGATSYLRERLTAAPPK